MPVLDYQTLSNPYLFQALKRLSDTKHPILILSLEQTIRQTATHNSLMPGIDYEMLINAYLSHAWNRLSDINQPILISCLE